MKRRIGERRGILGLMGVPFVAFGLGILYNNGTGQNLAPSVEAIATALFGWLWIIAGFLAVIAMLASGTKKVAEEVGYGLLFAPPFVWMAAYIITIIYGGGFAPFVGFLITGTFVVLILYLARYMRNG